MNRLEWFLSCVITSGLTEIKVRKILFIKSLVQDPEHRNHTCFVEIKVSFQCEVSL